MAQETFDKYGCGRDLGCHPKVRRNNDGRSQKVVSDPYFVRSYVDDGIQIISKGIKSASTCHTTTTIAQDETTAGH